MLLFFAAAASAQQVYSESDPGVTAPRVIEKAGAEYTPEARLARLEGSVAVRAIIETDGSIRDVFASRPLGLGLDENAIEAVKQWHFAPGTKNGEPVAVLIRVEVIFRMLTTRSDWHLTRADFETPKGASRPIVLSANFPAPAMTTSSTIVTFDIDEQGNAVNASDLADVMKNWKFQPATQDGKPIRVHATFAFATGSIPEPSGN
jgi:TonB family protein